jgi:hypothetical protein
LGFDIIKVLFRDLANVFRLFRVLVARFSLKLRYIYLQNPSSSSIMAVGTWKYL